jgi:hypothetical protein
VVEVRLYKGRENFLLSFFRPDGFPQQLYCIDYRIIWKISHRSGFLRVGGSRHSPHLRLQNIIVCASPLKE